MPLTELTADEFRRPPPIRRDSGHPIWNLGRVGNSVAARRALRRHPELRRSHQGGAGGVVGFQWADRCRRAPWRPCAAAARCGYTLVLRGEETLPIPGSVRRVPVGRKPTGIPLDTHWGVGCNTPHALGGCIA